MKRKKFQTADEYKNDRLEFLKNEMDQNNKNLSLNELLNNRLKYDNLLSNSWFSVRQRKRFEKDYNVDFKTEKLIQQDVKKYYRKLG